MMLRTMVPGALAGPTHPRDCQPLLRGYTVVTTEPQSLGVVIDKP